MIFLLKDETVNYIGDHNKIEMKSTAQDSSAQNLKPKIHPNLVIRTITNPYFCDKSPIRMTPTSCHTPSYCQCDAVCHECSYSDGCTSDCFESESDDEFSSQGKVNSPYRKNVSKVSALIGPTLFQLGAIKQR